MTLIRENRLLVALLLVFVLQISDSKSPGVGEETIEQSNPEEPTEPEEYR